MLDERKVKLMTRMALYEEQPGERGSEGQCLL